MKTSALTILLFCVQSFTVYATDYFINPTAGNDQNSGTSENQAWKTANPLEKQALVAGDRLLLHAGDTLRQSLEFRQVQGDEENPFTISRYGDGPDPVIIGKDANHAIYFFNPAHVIIEKVEVRNPEGEYGILMVAQDAGELKNVIIREVEVTEVFDASRDITEPSKVRGGIVFDVKMGEQPTWWNGIEILNSHIHDLGSCGITIGSDYKVVKAYEGGDARYPNLGVRIAHNKIHDIVRDGAIIRQCKGGVMEYNEVWRTGLVAVSNGMWWYDSDSCVIQYNEGHHCKAAFDKDGAPFSIDNSSTNCIIRHNYSHDNEGPGYMLFGHDDNGFGNLIYHNLSVNDHTNNTSSGTGSIAIVSRVRDARVVNNTIIAGSGTRMLLGHRSWDGYPIEVIYEGNLFVGNGQAPLSEHVLPAGRFKDNFFTNIPALPEALQEQTDMMPHQVGFMKNE